MSRPTYRVSSTPVVLHELYAKRLGTALHIWQQGSPVALACDYLDYSGEPDPVIMQVDVRSDQSAGQLLATQRNEVRLSAGASGVPAADVRPTNGNGGLLVEYGSKSCRRSIVCDLKSGTYVLPPSEQVRASVVVASAVEGQFLLSGGVQLAVRVGVDMRPGTMDRPDIMTLSAAASIAGGAAIQDLFMPVGARAADIWSGIVTTPGVNPAKMLSLTTNQNDVIIRNYSADPNQQWPPEGGPMIIKGYSSELGSPTLCGTSTYSIFNQSVVVPAITIGWQFWLGA